MQIPEDVFRGCVLKQRKAQEQLFQACYSESLKLVLRYIPSREDAKDVLIQSYFKVFTRIQDFSGTHNNLYGWIKRILINQALDFLKSKSPIVAEDIETIHHPLTEEIPVSEEDEVVLQLIQQLPEMHRKVFNLYALDGFSHKEIADICLISEQNSKYYVHAARKLLKERLFKTELS